MSIISPHLTALSVTEPTSREQYPIILLPFRETALGHP
jgi:hypothetical protein